MSPGHIMFPAVSLPFICPLAVTSFECIYITTLFGEKCAVLQCVIVKGSWMNGLLWLLLLGSWLNINQSLLGTCCHFLLSFLGCLSSPDSWDHHRPVFLGSSALYLLLCLNTCPSGLRIPTEAASFPYNGLCLCPWVLGQKGLPDTRVFPNLLSIRNRCCVVMTLNLAPQWPGSSLLLPLSKHVIENKLLTTQIFSLLYLFISWEKGIITSTSQWNSEQSEALMGDVCCAVWCIWSSYLDIC